MVNFIQLNSSSRFGNFSAVWTSLPHELTTLFESRLTSVMPTLDAPQLLSVVTYFPLMGVKYEDLKRGAQEAAQRGLERVVRGMEVAEFVEMINT